ncbi:MAG: penicillin-binding protein activator [Acidiferrobacterales bacterium]
MTSVSRTPVLAGVLLLASALQLQSCAIAPTKAPAPKPTPPPTTAEQAERSGDYVRAAEEYERAAKAAAAAEKASLQLKAVETLLKAGQIQEAHQKVQEIDTTGLETSLRARKLVLEAQIASQAGSPEDAIRLLDTAQRTRNLNPMLLSEIYLARADAELALGDPIGAAKNLIVREQYIVGTDAITENQLHLWQVLSSLPRATLKRERQTTTNSVLAGWLELAIAAVENAGRPALLAKSVSVWQRTHPGHPASESLLETLASAKPGLIGRIDQIAVLVPITSNYKVAAEAVLAGVLAMDAANPDPDKPTVTVYDIGDDASRAPEFYDKAVRDGAQLVIGPLGREAVDQVVKRAQLTVPALLLSHTRANEEPLPGYVFQFGLPPEQEAKQVAERAYLDGHRQAAVLYANSQWGKRMHDAFVNHWQQLGGILLTAVAYDPSQNDHSPVIKRLLNISQSEARRRTIEAKLGTKMEFQARRREDVDFVFLAADAKRGRLIKPQLNYHRALNIPVYATSHIFSGRPDQMRDTDLDGVMFGDMPWMLVNDGKIQQLRDALQNKWPYAHTQLDRLFALGVDSYAIVPYLNWISSENAVRFNGVTSSLSLGRDGRLHRQLLWAKFSSGVPELLDTFINYGGQLPRGKRDAQTTLTPSPRS